MVAGWHEFYCLIGTAAAALVALLFVAASIGAGYLSAKRGSPTRTFTSPIVFHYTYVLFVSLVALVPVNTDTSLAIIVGITAAGGLIYSIFVLGMVVTSLAATIETLFTGWELVGLSSALLVAFFQERPSPSRNGLWIWTIYRFSDAALLLAAVAMHHMLGEGDFGRLLGNEPAHPWPEGNTPATPTQALLSGSVAVNAGRAAGAPASVKIGSETVESYDSVKIGDEAAAKDPTATDEAKGKARTDAEPLPETLDGLEGRAEASNLVGIYAALAGTTSQAVLTEFAGQGFGQFLNAGVVIRFEQLALDDRKVNFDLIEPARVRWCMHDDNARMASLQLLRCAVAAMG